MIRMPLAAMEIISVLVTKMLIIGRLNSQNTIKTMTETTALIFMAAVTPSKTRSCLPAPIFCPV